MKGKAFDEKFNKLINIPTDNVLPKLKKHLDAGLKYSKKLLKKLDM